jgi:hypothetical protein
MDLAGLTNAMTDLLIHVEDKDLMQWGLQKGIFNSGIGISKHKFLEDVERRQKKTVAGGSPANVIHCAAKLGLSTALFGTVGNDSYGRNYVKELENTSIKPLFHVSEGSSGLCYILITPDGEKTTLADIGVAGHYDFDLKKMKGAKLFHTSGYELMTNPEKVSEAVEYAKSIGVKVSYDLAAPKAVQGDFLPLVQRMCEKYIDILFMTEEEAEAFRNCSPLEALHEMSEFCEVVALKKGAKGSAVIKGAEFYEQQILPAKVANTNGAGDAYAAGFLCAYLKSGGDARHAAAIGSNVAAIIVGIEQSHL